MEGLDLFVPTIKPSSSSSESEEGDEEEEEEEEEVVYVDEGYGVEGGYNMDDDMFSGSDCPSSVSMRERRPRRAKAKARFVHGSYSEEGIVDMDGEEEEDEEEGGGRRNFEIEKSQGLKLTLKKSIQPFRRDDSQLVEPTRVCSFSFPLPLLLPSPFLLPSPSPSPSPPPPPSLSLPSSFPPMHVVVTKQCVDFSWR